MKFGEVAAADKTLAEARKVLESATTPLQERMAADGAYLAACQAADVVAAHIRHPEPVGVEGRTRALRLFDRENKTDLENDFNIVYDFLHVDCYHEGKCKGLDSGFEAADRLINAVSDEIGFSPLPRAVSRNVPKRSKRRGRR